MDYKLYSINDSIKNIRQMILHYQNMWAYPDKIKYGFILKDQIHTMYQILKREEAYKAHYLKIKYPKIACSNNGFSTSLTY